ncbi:MAG: YbaK/EbsC family protein [Thermovenabulum sp.]|uniref:YbaK/EbsC family protein n=1 Tax=Thermovenabulum sp. TaxID=3100335 RepID=UPI003C7CBE27
MSVESVREYFKRKNIQANIMLLEDTSTVDKAARSLGVTPGEIAKSLLFRTKEGYIMIVMAGDRKIDNRKFKETFSCKARMSDPKEVEEVTGHPVGGVCPFGLKNHIDVYLDESLKNYEIVYPAAGDINAAVAMTVKELSELTGNRWVNVSQ